MMTSKFEKMYHKEQKRVKSASKAADKYHALRSLDAEGYFDLAHIIEPGFGALIDDPRISLKEEHTFTVAEIDAIHGWVHGMLDDTEANNGKVKA